MSLVVEDSGPALAGIQVRIGATVQVIDTSTDPNKKLSSVKVDWGDSTSVIMAPADTASHAYTKAGKRTITLTAIDLKGLKSKVKEKIIVVR
jgi:PKD repeat protein